MGIEDTLNQVVTKLSALEEKIDDLSIAIKAQSQTSIPAATSQPASNNMRKPSDVVVEQKEAEKPSSATSGRRKCPDCGSVEVQTMENKEKPISMSGGIKIYAKKYYCKKCGHEWE